MRHRKCESKFLQSFDELILASASLKMKGYRRASSRWHCNRPKKALFVFVEPAWGGSSGRKKREEGGTGWGEWGEATGRARLPFLSWFSPNLHAGPPWTGRDIDSQVAAQGDLTIRFITGDHLLVEISIALPERRHRRAMTDALLLRFPRIFIKTFPWSSRVLQGQLPWIAGAWWSFVGK